MNVWLIQIGETLPLVSNIRKLRTALLADKLITKGHSVLWWASAFDHLQKKWISKQETEVKISNNFTIKLLKGIGYKRNVSIRRFIDHRIIAKRFRELVSAESRPDIIVASLPSHDLAYEAVMYANKNNIPIIVDIRDPWPDIFLNHLPSTIQNMVTRLLRKDFTMVRECMHKADGLTSMMNALLVWGLQYAQRKATWRDDVFYLGYQKTDLNADTPNKIRLITDRLSSKFVVIFIGTFASYHNPTILLDVAEQLLDLDIIFVLAGDGELSNSIHKRASGMKNVLLPGWLNQDEISLLLQNADIGVCPAAENSAFFPNKAFTYLSEGLPIVSAFEGDLKKMLHDRKIGLYYSPNDRNALADCIRLLYKQTDLYRSMGENALSVFNEIGNADYIYANYVRHIERIAADKQTRGV